MSTLAICVCMASATVGGAIIGANIMLWYRKRHEPRRITYLAERLEVAQREAQAREVEVWQLVGQRYRQAIAVDLRRKR